MRISNNLVGILNFFTFIFSVLILIGGIWLQNSGSSECDKFLDKPVIILGVFFMLVSLAGLIGACCRASWLLWLYLFVMFILIVILSVFTVFAFLVTNRGAGRVLSNRGYKEYKLGDYSNWLQNRVVKAKNWDKIRSCLINVKVCSTFADKYVHDTVKEFYSENLSALQSGCCKPPDECNFTYGGPTVWTKHSNVSSSDPDCNAWNNDKNTLCFNCESCKAGLLDNLKKDWKKVAIFNIIFLIFLIVVYTIGCCAFRNNRRDQAYWK